MQLQCSASAPRAVSNEHRQSTVTRLHFQASKCSNSYVSDYYEGSCISSIICATAVQCENISYHLLVYRVRTVSYYYSYYTEATLEQA
jgi:hypothetical protein